jgi:hypothetical protein
MEATMNKLLASFLGVSLLVNGLALAQLARGRAPEPKARPAGGSAANPSAAPSADAPVPASADLAGVLAELRQLRREVSALRDGKAASHDPATPGRAPGLKSPADDDHELPASIANDPAVAKLLAEQEALGRLWKDLGKISGLKKSLGDEKYLQLVNKSTAEFLGLDASSRAGFESAAQQMMAELDAATKAMQEGYKGIAYDQKDPSAWQRHYSELTKRYNESRKAAESRLDPYLGTSARHQQFKQNLQTWAWYVNPNQWGDGSGMEWSGGMWDSNEEDKE